MPRLMLCAAIAILLNAPAPLSAAESAHLTIYHADNDALFSGDSPGIQDVGHAVVHETRTLDVTAGSHEVRIGRLPATVDPEAISLEFGAGPTVSVTGKRILLGGTEDGAIGRQVTVFGIGAPGADARGSLTGELLMATDNGQLIRTADGKLHMIHQYESMTMPADAYSRGSTLLLDVDAHGSGSRSARLTYTTSGLGWRAAYAATLASGEACRMQFQPEASIANRSGRDYRDAQIKLVAGQPNFGNSGAQRFRMSAPAPMAAEAHQMPTQASLGDYRSFTLPGEVTLPNGTVTLTPLYPARTLACQREYIVEDGGSGFPPKPQTNDYGANDYRDRAISSTLSFDAPEALPAGTLRAWIVDRDGAPALLGEGSLDDTPKGQRVAVALGQSFDLRASRDRTAFHVDAKAHTMAEAYRITLSNGGDSARTVTVREHPNRWREWSITSSSTRPSRQTPQLLEFKVPVPANGKTIVDYAIRYTWTAADM